MADYIKAKYFFCQEYFTRVVCFILHYIRWNILSSIFITTDAKFGHLFKGWQPNFFTIKIIFSLCNYQVICVVIFWQDANICPHKFLPPFNIHWWSLLDTIILCNVQNGTLKIKPTIHCLLAIILPFEKKKSSIFNC